MLSTVDPSGARFTWGWARMDVVYPCLHHGRSSVHVEQMSTVAIPHITAIDDAPI